MRPYFAIIIDSFRRATASKVLYVMLGMIVLLLLALSPLHLRETLDWEVRFVGGDVRSPQKLVQQLIERGRDGGDPGAARLWSMLDSDVQETIVELWEDQQQADQGQPVENDRRGRRSNDLNQYFPVIDGINEVIKQPEYYRAEDWAGVTLGSETRELIDEGPETLTQIRQRRLNRLLVSRAIPAIESGDATAMQIYYLSLSNDALSMSMTREQVASNVTQVMTWVFDKFVLSLGLLVGILVTANIIPETFDPGSLNLLLSKPVSRWALYLTKFFGGCFLIAICAVLLFSGLWLWMGLGIGVWDSALLWSIPLYILVFAIYYSVSAFIGLTYRSTILAVVVTGLFWAVCFALGSGYGFIDARMQNNRVYDPTLKSDRVLAYDGVGQLLRRGPDNADWQVAITPDSSEMQEGQEVALSIASWMGKLKEEPFRLPPVVSESGRAYVGVNFLLNIPGRSRQDFYTAAPGSDEFQQLGKYPSDAMNHFPTKDGLIVIDRMGDIKFLSEQQLIEGLAQKISASQAEGNPLETSEVSADDLMQSLGPDVPVRVDEVYSVAFNQSNQEIAIHHFDRGRHRLYVFARNGDQYQQRRSVQFDPGTDARMKCFVGYQGNTIVVIAGNGKVITFAGDTLEEQREYLPEPRVGIEQLAVSPDGRWFAMMFANQRLWLLDTQNPEELYRPSVMGQGNVSSISFDEQNQLCVVDRLDRLTVYDAANMSIVDERYTSSGTWLENLYRYLIRPLYTVFPKPSEFYKVVQHLSDTQNTERTADVDLIGRPVSPNPFAPLYSGLGFMVLMLLLSCLTFQFKDY